MTSVFLFFGVLVILLVLVMVDPSFSLFKGGKGEDYAVAEVVQEIDEDLVENGIHVKTGLIADQGYQEVVTHCTACHSAKLVTQNRMNAERWAATIDWMQETQNLWDLGRNEEIIINYLVKNYPPIKIGRRATLSNIEWYDLED